MPVYRKQGAGRLRCRAGAARLGGEPDAGGWRGLTSKPTGWSKSRSLRCGQARRDSIGAVASRHDQFGRTPIREALQRLAREGLITILPRKGILVSDINPRNQLLLLEVRASSNGC
jgi:hypothetical protein